MAMKIPQAGRAAIGGRIRSALALAIGIAALLLIAAVWFAAAPVRLPSIAELVALAERGRNSPLAPAIALLAFMAGGVAVFPINLLIAATLVVFGPIYGAIYALLGSLASAAVMHSLGRRLQQRQVARLLGRRGERLRRRIVGYGVLAVAIVRFLPLAPFSVVSFVAGAARVDRGVYAAGTALGMLPGIALYALFVDRALAALADPRPWTWLVAAAAALLIVALALAARAWLARAARR
jgi:uncharacterized membrane protein YdjX (TVP38/TMEM64 family)